VRRLAIVIGGVLLVGGALLAVVVVLAGRDDSGVGTVAGPGEALPDLCAEHRRGDPPRYNSRPPTSGPHLPRLPVGEPLRDADELLHALELGDVVIAYPDASAPAALRALQEDLSGPFDAELAAAGQAVILTRDLAVEEITALAWRHRLRAASPTDPALREFAEFWLGRGYASARGEGCPAPAG
jgi:hypothetical protein